MIESRLNLHGALTTKVTRAQAAPLVWRVKNTLRLSYLWGALVVWIAGGFAYTTGAIVFTSALKVRTRTFNTPTERQRYLELKDIGRIAEAEAYAKTHAVWTDYGVVSRRVITTAGVTALCTAWKDSTAAMGDFKYHGCGTGNTAEAAGDTALVTESTTALNPNSTRATGTNTNPSANVVRSVGTLIFDATAAVVEHGLFNQAATGGGTLWDRSVFSALNMASGDSIQFTYEMTANAGG